jgi:hypothetical protein
LSVYRLKHVRRPDPMVLRGRWLLGCDCGWQGSTDSFEGNAQKPRAQVEADLDALFVEHLPQCERELYLLIDQRMVVVEDQQDEDGKLLPRGNFIMPIGTPCLLTSWHEEGGLRWGHYLVPETGATGTLPIGEIRTTDHRVFKIDADA